MVWVIGAICMILGGAALLVIGVYLSAFGYAIVGGILVLIGIYLLVAFRRGGGPLSRNL